MRETCVTCDETGSWDEASAAEWNGDLPRTAAEFLALEEAILGAAARQADAEIARYLEKVHQDEAFVTGAIALARARRPGKKLRHKGRESTWVQLPGGTRVPLRTPYLREERAQRQGRPRKVRGPTGSGVYPVLEALGITDRVTPWVRREWSLLAIQCGSFREAAAILEQRGPHVEPTAVARVAQSTSQADQALRDEALAQACAQPVPEDGPLAGLRVRVSVDGGRVRTRDPYPGRKTARGRHRYDTPWREPRMLVIDVLDEKGATDKMRLPLYDVLMGDAEATCTLIIGYLRLLGAAYAQQVEFIADGAEWIWDRAEQIRQKADIPADRWREVVDFYHASEHLHEAVQRCRRVPADEREAWYEVLRRSLRRDTDGVDLVIESLHDQAHGRGARKVKEAITYFEKHRDRMAYAQLDTRHLPVGSGPVESAIRRVINLRFKGPSIFWNPDTVEDLMHLRAAFKAGRWTEMILRVLNHAFPPPSFEPLSPHQRDALLPVEPDLHNPETNVAQASDAPR